LKGNGQSNSNSVKKFFLVFDPQFSEVPQFTSMTEKKNPEFYTFNTILDTVGGTPAVLLHRVVASRRDVKVYAKVEGFNPGGSVKDRIALTMVEQAEADGILRPGATIIEATSGNTGIDLAMVGRIKGYKVIIVLSEAISVERRKCLVCCLAGALGLNMDLASIHVIPCSYSYSRP
jgi:hypothetical protein